MASKETQLIVQTVLQMRAAEDYGVHDPEPSSLAKFIKSHCQLEEDKSEALAWGENAELSSAELDRVAECFSVQRELLGALLNSASEETLEHILHQIAVGLNHECPACMELEERIVNNNESILELSLDVLVHVFDNSGAAEEDLLNEEQDLLDSLITIFPSLDRQAQIRVLGFACQEASGANGDTIAATFRAYSRLRQGYLSSLARRVFDQLTLSPSGSMSAEELAKALNLRDKRALGQVRRNVQKALLALNREGLELEETPLTVERVGKERIFNLSAEAKAAWKALLQAESNPMTGVEGLV